MSMDKILDNGLIFVKYATLLLGKLNHFEHFTFGFVALFVKTINAITTNGNITNFIKSKTKNNPVYFQPSPSNHHQTIISSTTIK